MRIPATLSALLILTAAERYRVIAPDVRGHGDRDAYGGELAEDIARLLDHLNIAKAHIVGYSMTK